MDVFAETGDKAHFKRLVLPCATYVDAAYAMRAYSAAVLLKHEPLDNPLT